MRFLICGLGSIGRRHFRNLLALGEEDILLHRKFRSTLPEEELAGFPVVSDLNTALAHQPDAIIISNPTALHFEVAIPAAQAGCHILLEKPISHSLERVDEFKDAIRQGGGKVLVGFQFRFHPGLRYTRHLLEEGAIGRPLSVRAHWGEYLPAWHPWEDYRISYSARADLGGGVILTLCHPLDYLRWLLGEVEALWAFIGDLSGLELDVEDTAEIGLRFANGVVGSVHLDYNQRPPSHHLEIVGTEGTIHWNDADGSVLIYTAEAEGYGNNLQVYQAPEDFERNALFLDEMEHFISVAGGEAQPICTLYDGIRALELALAAHDSSQLGRMKRWVR